MQCLLDMQTIKLVAVGDDGVGKQTLLRAFMKNKKKVLQEEVPIAENYAIKDVIGDQKYKVVLSRTGGEYYYRLRALKYPQTDVFLVCFSVVSTLSFEHLKEWVWEIHIYCPKTLFIFVGTQCDLRDDPETIKRLLQNEETLISQEAGDKLAKKLKALKYVECSALTQEGVDKVFAEAISTAIQPPEAKLQRRCILL